MAITILLVDDHPLFRKGLRFLLEEQSDFRVIDEISDGQEAIERVRAISPDVVIMDISMPNLDGIDATRQIVSEVPSAKVVALSMHSGKHFVEDMLKAGASGYILKESVPEDIVSGIRMVTQGDIYLSPAITGIVVSEYKGLLTRHLSPDSTKYISPILNTKLHRPALSPDLVRRTDLVARLDKLRCRPLTLVSAAAGYGKSTLASLWLDAWDGPYGWISLDEDENDPHKFVGYMLAAICKTFPEVCDNTRSLLQGPELTSISILSQHLVNDLDRIKDPFILVLDDYHKIREKKVHDLLGNLLTHPPRNMHLILLTRRDPPLLTSILRGRDQVNEISTADLCFTVDETAIFLKNSIGLEIDKQTAAAIHEKLEGWPAGMRLITKTAEYSGDIDSLIASLEGSFGVIVDYLVTEVLSSQPPEMAGLMAATSILNRFCAPLCDALLELDVVPCRGEMNGDEFIARLHKDNLFLIDLDPQKRWFRYHHMFRQLLRKQIHRQWKPEEVAAIHSRAKAWFAGNNMRGDASQDSPPAFGVGEHRTVPNATDGKSPSPRRSTSQSLVDPLTHRELDVLELLAQRLSNKEIAEKLFISKETVKGHLQSIYQKLNVGKRHDAVEKAKKLGILSQR